MGDELGLTYFKLRMMVLGSFVDEDMEKFRRDIWELAKGHPDDLEMLKQLVRMEA